MAGPSHERVGKQISIVSLGYRRQREPATLRRPRNISSARNSYLQTRECADPEYITVIRPPITSPYGTIEQCFRIQPGPCPNWCFASIWHHSTVNLAACPIPSPIIYFQDSRWSSVGTSYRRFDDSSSSEVTSSTRNGPIIVKSS